MTWIVRPAWESPVRAVLAVLVIVATEAALALAWREPLWAAVGALGLFAATARFFLPSRFVLNDDDVTVHFLGMQQRRPWSTLRRRVDEQRGLLLSPFARRSVLDGPRGIYLRLPATGDPARAAVCAFVDARLGKTK